MALIGNSAGLIFEITADSSDVDKKFKEFKKDLKAIDDQGKDAFQRLASDAGLSAKQFSLLKVGATAAATGIAAIAASAVAAGVGLFQMTQSAAEFGSEIYDASQKTGLGATAISSLKAAAEQSGSSLEAVTKGIARFAKQYEGTSTDLRAELGKTFKQIADAKPGFEQLTLAQEKFGKSGADLIPMINSFDGDLEGLIKRMEDLGITIDDEAAAAADAFGDQMDVLGAQIAGVGRTIGTAFMPQFTRMASSVSDWLVQNKTNVATFATVTANAFSTLLRGLESVAGWVERNKDVLNVIFNLTTAGAYGLVMYGLKSEFNRLSQPGAGTVQEASGSGRSGGFDPDKVPGLGKVGRGSNRDAEKAQREAEALARRDLAAQISLERNNLETIRQQLSETFDGIRKTFAADGDTDAFFASSQEAMERFTAALQTSLSFLDALENRSRATMTENEQALLTAEQLERRQQAVNLGKSEYAKNREELADKEKEWDQEANARAEYNIKLGREQVEIALEKMRVAQEFSDQMIANLALIDPALQQQPNGDGGDVAPYGPFQSWIDGWTQFVAQVEADAPTLGQTLQGLQGIFINAFQGMAQAMGGVVQQWVLMGSTGPAVMRKILASALASIAAEAAVRAIWELALGFATLFTNPSESAGHFIAAALFGTVAVGAGLAGRAIAGDAFKQQAQASTGSSSSSTANSGQGSAGKAGVYSSQEDMTVERGRNTPMGRLAVELVVRSRDAFADMFAFEISKNGRLRSAIQDAAAA